MSNLTRKTRADFSAAKLAESEAAADAARTGARYRRRMEAVDRVATAEALLAAGESLTAAALAELEADREEAQGGRNAPINLRPLARMSDRDVATLAAWSARYALRAERRAGWRVSPDERADYLTDVTAEVATRVLSIGTAADARAWFAAPYGTARTDARIRTLEAGIARVVTGEAGPMWTAAPAPTGRADLAAYLTAPTASRDRWRAALAPLARSIVWTLRQTAEHGGTRPVKLTAQEAREAGTADRYATAEADASALADVLALADRPLSDREARGIVLTLSGLTSREVAQTAGTTPAAERKNAQRARAALAERWPDRTALAADLTAADAARQRASEDAARDAATAAAADIGWDGKTAALALRDAHRAALADILQTGAARLQSERPARRLTGGAPTANGWRIPLALPAPTPDRYALPLADAPDRAPGADDVVTAALARQSVKRSRVAYVGWSGTHRPMDRTAPDATAALAAAAENTARALADVEERRARAWGIPTATVGA